MFVRLFVLDLGGQKFVDFECLMHILKLYLCLFCWFFVFGGVGGQRCVDFECLRHI